MLRFALMGVRALKPAVSCYYNAASVINTRLGQYSTLSQKLSTFTSWNTTGALTNNKYILDISKKITVTPVRSVTKFSLRKGKRKTVRAVVKRFFRLHWGGWIRTRVGRHKKLWKKSLSQKRRLREHVLCNATQCTLLDKMVTKFWKRPKYYVDDPYAPYHTREEFHITRMKPKDYVK